jgi:hypothetical protein
VFDMPPGKISGLLATEDSWHVYKVLTKEMMPQALVKRIMENKRFQDSMNAIKAAVKPHFNEAYFTPPSESQQDKAGAK